MAYLNQHLPAEAFKSYLAKGGKLSDDFGRCLLSAKRNADALSSCIAAVHAACGVSDLWWIDPIRLLEFDG